jgi:hypothetical protein
VFVDKQINDREGGDKMTAPSSIVEPYGSFLSDFKTLNTKQAKHSHLSLDSERLIIETWLVKKSKNLTMRIISGC